MRVTSWPITTIESGCGLHACVAAPHCVRNMDNIHLVQSCNGICTLQGRTAVQDTRARECFQKKCIQFADVVRVMTRRLIQCQARRPGKSDGVTMIRLDHRLDFYES
jgi:hypothetical protein